MTDKLKNRTVLEVCVFVKNIKLIDPRYHQAPTNLVLVEADNQDPDANLQLRPHLAKLSWYVEAHLAPKVGDVVNLKGNTWTK